MKTFKYILMIMLFLGIKDSKSSTLLESLNSAYLNNPKLNAERAKVRAVSNEKKEAIGDFLPNVTISGYVSEQDNTQGSESNFKPSQNSLFVEQKIFQGLGGVANFKKKDYEYSLAKFQLKKIEQEILLAATEAYADFLLAQKKVKINIINIDLLERQVETDKDRLEKGDINLTDLAQSEASLSGAIAKMIVSENELVKSKMNFEKIIGKKPNKNYQDIKLITIWLPKGLPEAYKISKNESPELQIALLEFEKSKQDVLIARSDLAPSATLSYEIAEQEDFSSTVQKRTQQTLKATATWPIFSGGSNYFNLKEAQELKNNKELLLQDSKKLLETNVTTAWSNYLSSMSLLESIKSQVKAAEIANEGITLEYESGSNRSTLDVIQSRTILLDSRTNLATSERDFVVSQFKLLVAIGRLTADQLNLKK